MLSLEALSRYDTPTIRAAFAQFSSESRDGHADDEKLFLANRYLFNVPEWVSAERALGFGGWFGIPQSEKGVNLLWPLHREPSGRLRLVGRQIGYLGPPFAAMDELDYLEKEYGRRPRQRNR
jgi:hypothetical protein